jgi:hypothetical protein
MESIRISTENKLSTKLCRKSSLNRQYFDVDFWVQQTLNILGIVSIVALLAGCQTAAPVQGPEETREDVEESLTAVAGALSGKQLSEEDVRNLEKQLREDEKAQSAVQAITESISTKAPVVKYCPVDGKRYAPHMETCPEHGVPLKIVEP